MMRIVSRAALVVTGTVLVDPSVAFACSCMPMTKAQQAENAALIFTGTVTGSSAIFGLGTACGPRSSFEPVYKGDAARQVTLTTAASGASCGYEFQAGKRYTVFATAADGKIETNLCRGNEAGAIVPAAYGLGAGRPPK